MKQNCWEFKKCGREVGGVKIREMGICPVALEKKLNAIHEGKNGGRACWIVEGSLCGNKVQGEFGKKFTECVHCEFYKEVKHEEGSKFVLSPKLLRIIREEKTD